MATRVNIGPMHPGIRGPLRLEVDLERDRVESVEPHIGFLHRGVEKLMENRRYMQNIAYVEKLDYYAPLAYGDAYIAAVEKAYGIEVKERAGYMRVVLLELQRLASHLFWLGTLAEGMDLPPRLFVWCFGDRDRILRLMSDAAGARMFYVNLRMGGLLRDFPPGFGTEVGELLTGIGERVDEYERRIDANYAFKERMSGVGVLDEDDAVALGVTGPVLRASGVDYDVRSSSPYYVYDKLGFRTHVRHEGDCFSRYKVRVMEMRESIRLVKSALQHMPAGDAIGMPARLVLPDLKKADATVSRETPRGEAMLYMIAGAEGPYRIAIRSPSFINLSALGAIAKGCEFSDLFPIINSLDLVMSDVDR